MERLLTYKSDPSCPAGDGSSSQYNWKIGWQEEKVRKRFRKMEKKKYKQVSGVNRTDSKKVQNQTQSRH